MRSWRGPPCRISNRHLAHRRFGRTQVQSERVRANPGGRQDVIIAVSGGGASVSPATPAACAGAGFGDGYTLTLQVSPDGRFHDLRKVHAELPLGGVESITSLIPKMEGGRRLPLGNPGTRRHGPVLGGPISSASQSSSLPSSSPVSRNSARMPTTIPTSPTSTLPRTRSIPGSTEQNRPSWTSTPRPGRNAPWSQQQPSLVPVEPVPPPLPLLLSVPTFATLSPVPGSHWRSTPGTSQR